MLRYNAIDGVPVARLLLDRGAETRPLWRALRLGRVSWKRQLPANAAGEPPSPVHRLLCAVILQRQLQAAVAAAAKRRLPRLPAELWQHVMTAFLHHTAPFTVRERRVMLPPR